MYLNPKRIGLNVPWLYFQLDHTSYQTDIDKLHVVEYADNVALYWMCPTHKSASNSRYSVGARYRL